MPGPTAQTTASWPDADAQRKRRRDVDALDVAVEAGACETVVVSQAPLAQRSNRVGEPERKRTAFELDVRDPHPVAEARTGGSQLAVQGAAHDRHPVEARPPSSPLLLLREPPRTAPARTAASSRGRPPRRATPSPRVRFA